MLITIPPISLKLLCVGLVLYQFVLSVDGGAALIRPRHRGMIWTSWNPWATHYNYMELNCGGRESLRRNGGRCGLCGDVYRGPRDHEYGGYYATNSVGEEYAAGERLIETKILLNTFSPGYFEFRLCDSNGARETQSCFNKHLLKVVGGGTQGHATRYQPERAGLLTLTLEIPAGLSCSRCVLQWKYRKSDHFGFDTDGRGCIGCGQQAEYYNCADIAIGGWISHTTTTPGPTVLPGPSGGSDDWWNSNSVHFDIGNRHDIPRPKDDSNKDRNQQAIHPAIPKPPTMGNVIHKLGNMTLDPKTDSNRKLLKSDSNNRSLITDRKVLLSKIESMIRFLTTDMSLIADSTIKGLNVSKSRPAETVNNKGDAAGKILSTGTLSTDTMSKHSVSQGRFVKDNIQSNMIKLARDLSNNGQLTNVVAFAGKTIPYPPSVQYNPGTPWRVGHNHIQQPSALHIHSDGIVHPHYAISNDAHTIQNDSHGKVHKTVDTSITSTSKSEINKNYRNRQSEHITSMKRTDMAKPNIMYPDVKSNTDKVITVGNEKTITYNIRKTKASKHIPQPPPTTLNNGQVWREGHNHIQKPSLVFQTPDRALNTEYSASGMAQIHIVGSTGDNVIDRVEKSSSGFDKHIPSTSLKRKTNINSQFTKSKQGSSSKGIHKVTKFSPGFNKQIPLMMLERKTSIKGQFTKSKQVVSSKDQTVRKIPAPPGEKQGNIREWLSGHDQIQASQGAKTQLISNDVNYHNRASSVRTDGSTRPWHYFNAQRAGQIRPQGHRLRSKNNVQNKFPTEIATDVPKQLQRIREMFATRRAMENKQILQKRNLYPKQQQQRKTDNSLTLSPTTIPKRKDGNSQFFDKQRTDQSVSFSSKYKDTLVDEYTGGIYPRVQDTPAESIVDQSHQKMYGPIMNNEARAQLSGAGTSSLTAKVTLRSEYDRSTQTDITSKRNTFSTLQHAPSRKHYRMTTANAGDPINIRQSGILGSGRVDRTRTSLGLNQRPHRVAISESEVRPEKVKPQPLTQHRFGNSVFKVHRPNVVHTIPKSHSADKNIMNVPHNTRQSNGVPGGDVHKSTHTGKMNEGTVFKVTNVYRAVAPIPTKPASSFKRHKAHGVATMSPHSDMKTATGVKGSHVMHAIPLPNSSDGIAHGEKVTTVHGDVVRERKIGVHSRLGGQIRQNKHFKTTGRKAHHFPGDWRTALHPQSVLARIIKYNKTMLSERQRRLKKLNLTPLKSTDPVIGSSPSVSRKDISEAQDSGRHTESRSIGTSIGKAKLESVIQRTTINKFADKLFRKLSKVTPNRTIPANAVKVVPLNRNSILDILRKIAAGKSHTLRRDRQNIRSSSNQQLQKTTTGHGNRKSAIETKPKASDNSRMNSQVVKGRIGWISDMPANHQSHLSGKGTQTKYSNPDSDISSKHTGKQSRLPFNIRRAISRGITQKKQHSRAAQILQQSTPRGSEKGIPGNTKSKQRYQKTLHSLVNSRQPIPERKLKKVRPNMPIQGLKTKFRRRQPTFNLRRRISGGQSNAGKAKQNVNEHRTNKKTNGNRIHIGNTKTGITNIIPSHQRTVNIRQSSISASNVQDAGRSGKSTSTIKKPKLTESRIDRSVLKRASETGQSILNTIKRILMRKSKAISGGRGVPSKLKSDVIGNRNVVVIPLKTSILRDMLNRLQMRRMHNKTNTGRK